MRHIRVDEHDAEREFAEKAAKHFASNPEDYTFGELASGDYIARRWGMDNDGILVLKLDEFHEPTNYWQLIRKVKEDQELSDAFAGIRKPTIDALVGDATRFEFKTTVGDQRAAYKGASGYWRVHGFDYRFNQLNDLQKRFGVRLDTIIPLIVDPAYIEARR